MKTMTTPRYERRIIRHSVETRPWQKEKRVSLFRRLQLYIEKQNAGESRFQWVGTTMIVQAVIITPIAGFVIMQTGNHPLFWFFCTAAMYLTFIPSLSGLPAKAVLSAFFISILMNITILVAAIAVHIFF